MFAASSRSIAAAAATKLGRSSGAGAPRSRAMIPIGSDAPIARCMHPSILFDTSHVYSADVPGPFGRVAAPPPHFPVGGPVPASDLVGREAYIRRITERLTDGNHVLLAGPRRIGKTSLILEVLRRLRRKGASTAYVDCLGATDVRGLGERLV